MGEGWEQLTLREGFLEEATVAKNDQEFTRQMQPLNWWKERWDSSQLRLGVWQRELPKQMHVVLKGQALLAGR